MDPYAENEKTPEQLASDQVEAIFEDRQHEHKHEIYASTTDLIATGAEYIKEPGDKNLKKLIDSHTDIHDHLVAYSHIVLFEDSDSELKVLNVLREAELQSETQTAGLNMYCSDQETFRSRKYDIDLIKAHEDGEDDTADLISRIVSSFRSYSFKQIIHFEKVANERGRLAEYYRGPSLLEKSKKQIALAGALAAGAAVVIAKNSKRQS